LPRPTARLVARDKNDREVRVELDVHGAHLALGIVDLVDAFLLLLDALGVLATEIGQSGGHLGNLGLSSSSSAANDPVLPRASTKAMAKAFIMGTVFQIVFTYRKKRSCNNFIYFIDINKCCLEMNCTWKK
jgi:hypothetical protein